MEMNSISNDISPCVIDLEDCIPLNCYVSRASPCTPRSVRHIRAMLRAGWTALTSEDETRYQQNAQAVSHNYCGLWASDPVSKSLKNLQRPSCFQRFWLHPFAFLG
jgi:hypothetical protein